MAKIIHVSNIMIDSLEMMKVRIEKENTMAALQLERKNFCLVTLHRLSNVDHPEILAGIMEQLEAIGAQIQVIFPVHPHTRKCLLKLGKYQFLEDNGKSASGQDQCSNIVFTEPLAYVAFMNLVFNSRLVITDSGGIQEETTYQGIPCLILRENTKSPITVTQGTNRLCTPDRLTEIFKGINADNTGSKNRIEMWDGNKACRIVKHIDQI